MRVAWFEHGAWKRAPAWWYRAGPFVLEFHPTVWMFGAGFSTCYVAVMVGPLRLTIGKRTWREGTRKFTVAWSAEDSS